MGILTGLEPQNVFDWFEQLAAIPHGSGHTKPVSDWLASFARERGLKYVQDGHDNVIIWKSGSGAGRDAAPVILQGHMDMVCEREAGFDFDFEKEGLRLRVEDGTISAEGTTLGGDDGIAVAYCLALLDAEDIPHPPLEVVFTADEEIGMLGAAALDKSLLQGRLLLNLDSEDEGILLVSCAGGVRTNCILPVCRAPFRGTGLRLRVSGLLGGHSGVEIDKGRANANAVLGRALCRAARTAPFRLAAVSGGLQDNAIPRQAEAVLVAETAADAEKLAAAVRALSEALAREYRASDPGIRLSAEPAEVTPADPMDADSTQRVITALRSLPCGIQRMSFEICGLVETSLNLGILETAEQEVRFSFCVRSSVESEKDALVEQLSCLTESLGGRCESSGAYPAWEYRADSPLRELMTGTFERQYGRKPVVQAIHAGVECGLFAGALEGLDAVSFGPDMKNIHTPDETMDVRSVKRTWDYLLAVLRELACPPRC